MSHEDVMRQCLLSAALGRGKVGNGALVGAVLVRDGTIVARGYHEGFSKPHAEQQLLEKVDQKLCSLSTLYVNLEPCCHQGKTPPCTDLIIQKGVKKVCFGAFDPDCRVAGRGCAALRAAGVEVIGPVLPELCRRHNRGFFSVREKGRPFVTIKRAQKRDGRIAQDDGSPLAITSKEQNQWSHTALRAMHDAIVVGVQTVITDDPSLTVRYQEDMNKKIDQGMVQPYRIILDPHLRIPLEATVLNDDHRERTMVVYAEGDPATVSALHEKGVDTLSVSRSGTMFEWSLLWRALLSPHGLHFHGLTSLLIEGGERTWEAWRQSDVVDEEIILVGQ